MKGFERSCRSLAIVWASFWIRFLLYFLSFYWEFFRDWVLLTRVVCHITSQPNSKRCFKGRPSYFAAVLSGSWWTYIMDCNGFLRFGIWCAVPIWYTSFPCPFRIDTASWCLNPCPSQIFWGWCRGEYINCDARTISFSAFDRPTWGMSSS